MKPYTPFNYISLTSYRRARLNALRFVGLRFGQSILPGDSRIERFNGIMRRYMAGTERLFQTWKKGAQ